jgi:hypothetical protein
MMTGTEDTEDSGRETGLDGLDSTPEIGPLGGLLCRPSPTLHVGSASPHAHPVSPASS